MKKKGDGPMGVVAQAPAAAPSNAITTTDSGIVYHYNTLKGGVCPRCKVDISRAAREGVMSRPCHLGADGMVVWHAGAKQRRSS